MMADVHSGQIISSQRELYRVRLDDAPMHSPVLCRGRGVFRDRSITPTVGDRVLCRVDDVERAWGTIVRVLPRKNLLFRPPVANIDQVLLVQTLCEPAFNAYALDKLLVVMERARLPILICFNKMDRAPAEALRAQVELYESVSYRVFPISALKGEGIPRLRDALQQAVTAIAGPSGAGKSTLIRYLSGDVRAQSGALSEKTGRGKQTTRHTEMFSIGEGSYLFDTPGFSSLDLRNISHPLELADCFPEFRGLAPCRFRNCTHREEPGCSVRSALEAGKIAPSRYENYRLFYQEVEAARRYS